MRADQPRHAIPRAAGFIDRRDDGCVVTGENFQEKRAGQLLLRPEEMEEAAIRSSRAPPDGGHRRALKSVAVEHRQTRRQQILTRRGHRLIPQRLDSYSRVAL